MYNKEELINSSFFRGLLNVIISSRKNFTNSILGGFLQYNPACTEHTRPIEYYNKYKTITISSHITTSTLKRIDNSNYKTIIRPPIDHTYCISFINDINIDQLSDYINNSAYAEFNNLYNRHILLFVNAYEQNENSLNIKSIQNNINNPTINNLVSFLNKYFFNIKTPTEYQVYLGYKNIDNNKYDNQVFNQWFSPINSFVGNPNNNQNYIYTSSIFHNQYILPEWIIHIPLGYPANNFIKPYYQKLKKTGSALKRMRYIFKININNYKIYKINNKQDWNNLYNKYHLKDKYKQSWSLDFETIKKDYDAIHISLLGYILIGYDDNKTDRDEYYFPGWMLHDTLWLNRPKEIKNIIDIQDSFIFCEEFYDHKINTFSNDFNNIKNKNTAFKIPDKYNLNIK